MSRFGDFRWPIGMLFCIVLAVLVANCGKKGPPEAPNQVNSEKLDDR